MDHLNITQVGYYRAALGRLTTMFYGSLERDTALGAHKTSKTLKQEFYEGKGKKPGQDPHLDMEVRVAEEEFRRRFGMSFEDVERSWLSVLKKIRGAGKGFEMH